MLIRVLTLVEETETLYVPSIHDEIADVQFDMQADDERESGWGIMQTDYTAR
jgi:hypothetical protein